MTSFEAGDKLSLRSRHQSHKDFADKPTIGEVVEGTEGHPHKMKVRVYGDWRPPKGYLHEFLRVTDEIWLERIGKKGDHHPSVHQIVGKLDETEFKKRRGNSE